ncbi:MAG TPA: hypothetical protein VMT20_15225 [Terriglobia bacterium]|nr:hypothetical protein [Terriglobia bacterium]
MPLASLYAVEFPTPEALDKWAFNHAQHHYAIVRALQAQGGSPHLYQLYPMNTEDLMAWNLDHATMHQEMDAVASENSNNMLTVNFGDPSELRQFLYYNYQEHLAVAKFLNLNA